MGASLIADNLEGKETATPKRFDPYLQFVEMPFSKVFYPLGFPVQVMSNCAEILEAAEENWGDFQQAVNMQPILFKFGVMEGGGTECPPAPVSRAQHNIIVRIADAANFYIVDLLRGFSFGWLMRLRSRTGITLNITSSKRRRSPISSIVMRLQCMPPALNGRDTEFYCAATPGQVSLRLPSHAHVRGGLTLLTMRAF